MAYTPYITYMLRVLTRSRVNLFSASANVSSRLQKQNRTN